MGEYSWEASWVSTAGRHRGSVQLGGIVGEYSWEASWVNTAGRHRG